ncbi:hypothetical protein R3P38DRAFT_2760521 [Favolaschia claudopus]|uniref:Uncharacterized protein n=1 Tax=Favolaschia claudopus TaxID=2862362 RepID=A0AAW0DR67_9AGAR
MKMDASTKGMKCSSPHSFHRSRAFKNVSEIDDSQAKEMLFLLINPAICRWIWESPRPVTVGFNAGKVVFSSWPPLPATISNRPTRVAVGRGGRGIQAPQRAPSSDHGSSWETPYILENPNANPPPSPLTSLVFRIPFPEDFLDRLWERYSTLRKD